jgi:hypothetical protein
MSTAFPRSDISRRQLSARILLAAAGASVRPPAALAQSSSRVEFVGGGQSSGWCPFDIRMGTLVFIRAIVNGVPVSAVIDSGAGRSVIDHDLASKINLSTRTGFIASGIQADVAGGLADGVSVVIGRFKLNSLSVAVLDLSNLSAISGQPIQVVIGRELFDSAIVDFDFPRHRVAFYGSGALAIFSRSERIPLVARDFHRRYVPAAVAGGAPIEACFDLGSDIPLMISPQYATDNRLLEGLRVSTTASSGIEGLTVNQVAVLSDLVVGGIRFINIPIEIPPNWNQSGPAVIGLPVWTRFRAIIEYAHDSLMLIPDSRLASTPFPKDRSGIGATRAKGRLEIIHVAAGSPAEAAGLRIGDEIESVDGQRVDAAYLLSHPQIGDRPAGTIIELGLKGGRSLKLRLADYF